MLMATVRVAVLSLFVSPLGSEPPSEEEYRHPQLGDYPYIVAVVREMICTGVILHPQWVLTAAHCLYTKENIQVVEASSVTVLAGIVEPYLVYNEKNSGMQRRSGLRLVVASGFKYDRVAKHDVALLQLDKPLVLDANVQKARLWAEGWPQDRAPVCEALGFGRLSGDSRLRRWPVAAHHGETACPCLRRFQWKRLVCDRELRAPRLCHMDDGGPLVCNGSVVALGHMTWDRDNCHEPAYPQASCETSGPHGVSAYYFLCPLGDWLHGVLPDLPPRPASCRAVHSRARARTLLVPSLVLALAQTHLH